MLALDVRSAYEWIAFRYRLIRRFASRTYIADV
jgi:hypothetical protein